MAIETALLGCMGRRPCGIGVGLRFRFCLAAGSGQLFLAAPFCPEAQHCQNFFDYPPSRPVLCVMPINQNQLPLAALIGVVVFTLTKAGIPELSQPLRHRPADGFDRHHGDLYDLRYQTGGVDRSVGPVLAIAGLVSFLALDAG